MNPADSYRQFCPVAMAAEIFCTRWTPLILRELVSGSTRFNDLRRGMPRISPTLLSKRLKQLEEAGVVTKQRSASEEVVEYRLTPAGEELKAVVFDLGFWGQRWIEAQSSLKNLDPSLLMWDMRRNLDPTPIPPGRSVIQIVYPELQPGKRNWWLVVEGGETDLCNIDPGFEVDLHLVTDLRTMTAIWMGLTTVKAEENAGRLEAIGSEALKRAMQQWLGLSPFAVEKKRVPA
ncbi:MAG: winged helix-turn-helix transcriptional regulator [Rhizobiaceae bacterium]